MTATIDTLLRMDAVLERAGHPPLSPWWRGEAARFYRAGAREWAARVGRGGSKSTTLVKLALNETLWGDWIVPPGERHYFAIVSIRQDEAAQRLRLIESCMSDLGVPYTRSGDVIDLGSLPLGFRVLPCTIGAVSGFRCIGWAADECAKWRSADSASNPAAEVIASMRAMTVTHPLARGAAFSSPFGTLDYHFALCEEGDTPRRMVSEAPTWIASPHVTERQTRELEPDERIWSREYAARPQPSELAAFDPAAVERAMSHDTSGLAAARRVIVLDPSSGRKDAWTWAVVGWSRSPASGREFLVFDHFGEQAGRFWGQVSGETIVARLATLAADHDVGVIHSDQRESLMLESAVRRHNLGFVVHDWTNASKQAAVEWLRRQFADSTIALPDHDKLRRELLMFEERLTPSGALTFGARGSGHDDYVALLITSAMAELGGHLQHGGGTIRPGKWRDPEYMGRAGMHWNASDPRVWGGGTRGY